MVMRVEDFLVRLDGLGQFGSIRKEHTDAVKEYIHSFIYDHGDTYKPNMIVSDENIGALFCALIHNLRRTEKDYVRKIMEIFPVYTEDYLKRIFSPIYDAKYQALSPFRINRTSNEKIFLTAITTMIDRVTNFEGCLTALAYAEDNIALRLGYRIVSIMERAQVKKFETKEIRIISGESKEENYTNYYISSLKMPSTYRQVVYPIIFSDKGGGLTIHTFAYDIGTGVVGLNLIIDTLQRDLGVQ